MGIGCTQRADTKRRADRRRRTRKAWLKARLMHALYDMGIWRYSHQLELQKNIELRHSPKNRDPYVSHKNRDPWPTPNLPTKIMPTKIRWRDISGKLHMGLRIRPLDIKMMLESTPLKSRIIVRRLAVRPYGCHRPKGAVPAEKPKTATNKHHQNPSAEIGRRRGAQGSRLAVPEVRVRVQNMIYYNIIY